jgi:hypothetical protein
MWGVVQLGLGYVVGDCRGYMVAGFIENKAKPFTRDLAKLANTLSRGGVVAEDM